MESIKILIFINRWFVRFSLEESYSHSIEGKIIVFLSFDTQIYIHTVNHHRLNMQQLENVNVSGENTRDTEYAHSDLKKFIQ